MSIRTITNDQLKAAYFRGRREGTLCPQGACEYAYGGDLNVGCIIGLALTREEKLEVLEAGINHMAIHTLLEIVNFEDLCLAEMVQRGFDRHSEPFNPADFGWTDEDTPCEPRYETRTDPADC